MNYFAWYSSPIGTLQITADEQTIVGVDFVGDGSQIPEGKQSASASFVVLQCIRELDEYFGHKRTEFTVPVHQEGTPFQVSVWKALRTIPFGQTRSYLDIATQVKNPKAVRAVGMTNRKNPIAIIVPCHRVIGKNGKMVGYASGVWRKEWLLGHEKKYI